MGLILGLRPARQCTQHQLPFTQPTTFFHSAYSFLALSLQLPFSQPATSSHSAYSFLLLSLQLLFAQPEASFRSA